MIVSTKGRYALRVMIDLAEHQSEKYVPLKEVAARQGRRLPADPQPGSVYGKRDFDAH